MSLLIGAMTIGLILSLLALGVFISFRIFEFPDITADGSSTLGAAVAAALIVQGINPLIASAAGFAAGFVAGSLTGVLATKFKINGLLAGILVMTALYSVNLHIMGRSNVPLLTSTTLSTYAQNLGTKLRGSAEPLNILGWDVTVLDASTLVLVFLAILLVGLLLYWFFQTNIGTAMRATGDNAQMIRALGVSDDTMIILGLAVSNGLIGSGGSVPGAVSGIRRRANGNRHGGVGTRQRNYWRGPGGCADSRLDDYRRGDGFGALPSVGGYRVADGTESQRSEADYRRICFRCAHRSRIPQQAQIPEGRPFPCLKSNKFGRPSTRAPRMR